MPKLEDDNFLGGNDSWQGEDADPQRHRSAKTLIYEGDP